MLGKKRIEKIIAIVAMSASMWYVGLAQAVDDVEAGLTQQNITDKWKCKNCPYAKQAKFSASVDLGLGYVTSDSYKFGEYTGLNEQGVYFLGDANGNYRDTKANYYNFDIRDIGLDSRIIEMEGGKQGLYDLKLEYNQIPKYTLDLSRTPYSGGSNQTLPSGWTKGATTPGFSTLENDLQNINIYTMRRDFSLGSTIRQSKTISYDLRFRRISKKGNQAVGAALGQNVSATRSVILAAPVDYTTDIAEVSMLYNANRIRGKIAYQVSLFTNDNQALRWQNAYSEPVTVTEGQMGTPPDNRMHQFSLAGGYDVLDNTMITGQLAFGQMKQDESFLPYSSNSNVSPPGLPRNSLGGEINTFVGNFNVLSHLTPKLNLNFKYAHDEQDNNTPRGTYDYVINDTELTTNARANLPYSFRKRKTLLEGNYKLPVKSLLSLGADYEVSDRTYQEVETTKENSFWAKFKSRPHSMVDLFLILETSSRDGDAYTPVADIAPPAENALLRKFNMADRDRDRVNLQVNLTPINSLVFGLTMDTSKDDYSASQVGLTGSKEKAYTLDVYYMLTKVLSINGFYSVEEIKSNQSNVQGSSPWFAENKDNFDTAGFGIDYHVIEDKLDIGVDFVHAEGTGKVNVDSKTPFPDLVSKRDTVEFYSNYQFNEQLLLKFIYRYEKYDESDWAIDGVSYNTLDNVLTLGEQSPSYKIGSFALTGQYKF